LPVGQNSRRAVKPRPCKYSTLPKFGFVVHARHPGPRQGADRDRHEPRAGQRWTRRRRARQALQGGFGRERWPSRVRHGADSAFAWLRGRAHATPRIPSEDVRGRRSRVVLTPGVCASSQAVMPAARPGPRIGHLQGDGGNSATLPEESTKDTVKTIRAGKAGRPATPVVHPVCIFVAHGSRVPAGARPSLRPCLHEGDTRSKTRAKRAAGMRSRVCCLKCEWEGDGPATCSVIARSPCDEAIQNPSEERSWIASLRSQ